MSKLLGYFINSFEATPSGGRGWYRFSWPFDDSKDKSAAFHPEYKIVKDFRSGLVMRAYDFIAKYENSDYEFVKQIIDRQKGVSYKTLKLDAPRRLSLPDGYKPFSNTSTFSVKAQTYLQRRGFNVSRLDLMGFGYCDLGKFFGRIICPITRFGELVYYVGRDFMGQEPRYLNASFEETGATASTVMFNQDALWVQDMVYITEGIFDALTLGDKGVALLGWALTAAKIDILLKSPCRTIVLCPDRGFQKKWIGQFIKIIGHKEVYILNPDNMPKGKDVNDWGMDAVIDSLDELEQITYQNIFKYA